MVLVVMLIAAAGAPADTVLRRSTPGDGTTVSRTPAQVRALHEGPLGAVVEASAVLDGRDVLASPPKLDPTDVRALLVPVTDGGPGTYEVTWVARAADGHPLAGRTTFRVRAPSLALQIQRLAAILIRAANRIVAATARGGAMPVNT